MDNKSQSSGSCGGSHFWRHFAEASVLPTISALFAVSALAVRAGLSLWELLALGGVILSVATILLPVTLLLLWLWRHS